MSTIDKYKIGDIVTIKSHPLLHADTQKNSNFQFPPLLLVKEILLENEKKKLFSDEIKNTQIADNLKCICVYFSNKKSKFVEVHLYDAYLASYKDLKSIEEEGESNKSETNQNEEEDKSNKNEIYNFGGIVQLKTRKVKYKNQFKIGEKYKFLPFLSPNFVLTGVKKGEVTGGLFYHNGKPKRKVAKQFYKVMWFNHFQNKFSEEYLPEEFFIKPLVLAEKTELNEKPKD